MSNGEPKKTAWPDFHTYMTEFKRQLMAEKNPCGEIVASKHMITELPVANSEPTPPQPEFPEPPPSPLSAEHRPLKEEFIDISTIGGEVTKLAIDTSYKSLYYSTEASYTGGATGGMILTGRITSPKGKNYASSYSYSKAALSVPEPEYEKLIVGEEYLIDDTSGIPIDDRGLHCIHDHGNKFTLRALDFDRVDYDNSYRVAVMLRCNYCGDLIHLAIRVPESSFTDKILKMEDVRGRPALFINAAASEMPTKWLDQLLCILPINEYPEEDKTKHTDPNKLFAMMESRPDD